MLAYMKTTSPFQCSTGKIVYVTMHEARHASRGKAYKGKRKPYVCPECAAWHLTSRAPQSRRHRKGVRRVQRAEADRV